VSGDAESYHARLRNEMEHYGRLLAGQTGADPVQQIEPKVPAFEFAMRRYSDYVKSKMPTSGNLDAHVVERARRSSRPVQLLSLGAGTGDWELKVARTACPAVEVTLVDVNDDLMRGARAVAADAGIPLCTRVEDVNAIRIEPGHYDVIVCRSSLHHFMELEHVLGQIRGGLALGGEFLVLGEYIGRNGLMLYPETEVAAGRIFSALPPRLRLNHYTKQVDEALPNFDHSQGSFEAVRSQDIMPLLMKDFFPVEFVTFDAFVSLLLDWRYGPNYDLSDSMDQVVVALITDLDILAIANGILRPTALFGIFR
jgi:SAM-dependent methyltransferase